MADTRVDMGPTASGRGPTPVSTRRGRRSLADAFDPRRNGLGALRLVLALVVAVTHATGVGFGHQPRARSANLSDLAVDAFFVLSGFLVTRSALRLPTVRRYVWHRFLRIMPGFWMCLLVTAAVAAPVAAALAGRSPLSVLTAAQDPAWRYVLVNSALPVLQYPIAGLGQGGGPPSPVLDGALWTLKYEALCYALVAGLVVVAGLRRRRWPVLALCAAAWAATALHSAGGPGLDLPLLAPDDTNRFMLTFLLGAVAHLYAREIPVSAPLVAVSASAVVAGLAWLPDYEVLGGPGLAYLCVCAATLRLPRPRWDLSYGVYVYHWPVQFVLALGGAQVVGELGFAVVSVGVASVCAVLSWLLVERRALSFKDARWVDAGWRERPEGSPGARLRRTTG